MALASINPFAVILATIAAQAIGFLWYSPVLFGNQWMRALGKRPDEIGRPGPSIAIAAISALVSALVLALLIPMANAQSLIGGLMVGLLAGIGFVTTAILISGAFEGRPRMVSAIFVGYQLVTLSVMGMIIGVFG